MPYPNEYSETCVCGAGMTASGNATFIRMQRESFHFRHRDCSKTAVPGRSRMMAHPDYQPVVSGGSVGMFAPRRCVRCNTDQNQNPYPQWAVIRGEHHCVRCATEID